MKELAEEEQVAAELTSLPASADPQGATGGHHV